MASTYIFKHLTKFMTLSPGPATRGACGYASVPWARSSYFNVNVDHLKQQIDLH